MALPKSEAHTNALLMGAALVGVTSTSYLGFVNVLCCAGMIGGGMYAVYRYTSDTSSTITGGEGASLGFKAGLIGALIGLLLTFALRMVGIRDDLVVANYLLNNPPSSFPPEALDQIAAQADQPVWKTTFSFGTLISLLVTGAFAALGGAIGASVFKKGGEIRPEQTY